MSIFKGCSGKTFQRENFIAGAPILGALLFWGHIVPAQAETPSADALLQAMGKAERTIQYSGVAEMARQGAPTMVVRIWRSGSKRRLEYSAPQVMVGDLLIDDGSSVWRYHRADNSAVQTRSAARSGDGAIDIDKEDRTFNLKLIGTATTAGRTAWVVSLTPRAGNGTGRKFWIDRATKALLRVERLKGVDSAAEYVALRNVKFGAVPTAQFRWSPPPQANVTRTSGTLFMQFTQARRAARSWLQFPHYKPRGYVFESAVVDASKGEAWLRYTNGLSRFSIFQQRAPNGGTKELQRVRGAWYWQRGGSRFLLVGPPVNEASKVAASVR
jgi:outer membrane lipoprotein-sorting protein